VVHTAVIDEPIHGSWDQSATSPRTARITVWDSEEAAACQTKTATIRISSTESMSQMKFHPLATDPSRFNQCQPYFLGPVERECSQLVGQQVGSVVYSLAQVVQVLGDGIKSDWVIVHQVRSPAGRCESCDCRPTAVYLVGQGVAAPRNTAASGVVASFQRIR
jgi:hypothetical protein